MIPLLTTAPRPRLHDFLGAVNHPCLSRPDRAVHRSASRRKGAHHRKHWPFSANWRAASAQFRQLHWLASLPHRGRNLVPAGNISCFGRLRPTANCHPSAISVDSSAGAHQWKPACFNVACCQTSFGAEISAVLIWGADDSPRRLPGLIAVRVWALLKLRHWI